MNMRLGLRDNRATFNPGEMLDGAVLWESPEKPTLAEVRLLWFTRGKGTEDGEVVETVTFDNPQVGDTRQFTIRLPNAPYSFNGKLIALTWAVELFIEPGDHFQRVTFTMGPGGEEVRLPMGAPDETKSLP
jgi:hypothetical protein